MGKRKGHLASGPSAKGTVAFKRKSGPIRKYKKEGVLRGGRGEFRSTRQWLVQSKQIT